MADNTQTPVSAIPNVPQGTPLIALTPNGTRIVAEYWGQPNQAYTAFAANTSQTGEWAGTSVITPGVHALIDYGTSRNTGEDVFYPKDQQGRDLRWLDEQDILWAAEDLRFEIDTDDGNGS